jgi:hypothetical protein
MPNVLHLSDTTLSGSPIRICKLLNKHSKRYKARHLVWQPVFDKRVFEVDMVSSMMTNPEITEWIRWADIIHYHNRHGRQQVFSRLGIKPPDKPSVIQIHSPRFSENFTPEVESGVPLAIIAQYHPRQWPEGKFIVPNVVDITDPVFTPVEDKPVRTRPIVSYAPSNTTAKGWDDKGYAIVRPHL